MQYSNGTSEARLQWSEMAVDRARGLGELEECIGEQPQGDQISPNKVSSRIN